MSKTDRERGALVPGTRTWAARQDEMVRTLPAKQAARRTGRTVTAAYDRRRDLKLPDGRRGETQPGGSALGGCAGCCGGGTC
jgi:hypothetical protein